MPERQPRPSACVGASVRKARSPGLEALRASPGVGGPLAFIRVPFVS